MSALQKRLQSKGLPPLPMSSSSHSSRGRLQKGKKDFSLKHWKDYFDESKTIEVGLSKFNIYCNGNSGPLIVFLHGGGFSGLSWALLTKHLTSLVECRCVAIDFRGHGETATHDDYNLSAETLAGDVCDIISTISDPSHLILIGHSMGGAIAVHAANTNRLHSLAGLVVIDVVEGTALESLHTMHHVLQNRPSCFESIEKANEWCVRSGYIRNLESARVSMIGQLKRQEWQERKLMTAERMTMSSLAVVNEEEENNIDEENGNSSSDSMKYCWRIDLSKTEKFWEGWFRGLSSSFLAVPVPKMLMLAGVDRLDRELSIGQMQGKFQMQIMEKSGHALHEDIPDKVAQVISNFLVRHKLATHR
ncbi:protein phosphatase methylesterase 1-like isoform X2 [Clavelina lepadiformis]|uniref:protein phosphatase methylesterase 1-like isoform X2 n=1 Tax=Clavelina lepadiformis TaxID=159417 RepID=UPI0040428583